MDKRTILIIVVVIISAVSIWFFRDWFFKIPIAELKVESVLIKESSDKEEIEVHYPKFTYSSNTNEINKIVEEKFQNDIDSFKEDVEENAITELDAPSLLQINYDTVLLTNDVVSIRFDTLYYITGMAHPNSYYDSFNYDFKKNKLIQLADLFLPDSNYLGTLSDFCRKALKKQIDPGYYSEDFVNPGTEPKLENFSVFNFTKDKLVITFNPYQVGPWALGPQFVEIPFEGLDNLREISF